MSNASVGWTDKGDWTIKATNVAPTLGSVTPAALTSAPAAAQTFSAVYSDADGYANLKHAYLLVNTTASGANGIYLLHDRTVNKLYLYNDAGTGYVGNCTPGVAGSLSNTPGDAELRGDDRERFRQQPDGQLEHHAQCRLCVGNGEKSLSVCA